MTEPTVTCPDCGTEIRLTESLAAPLIAETRRELQAQIAQKERDVSSREAALKAQVQEVAAARAAIEEELADRLKLVRAELAEEAAAKARQAAAADLAAREQELAETREVLKARDAKLAEAQKAQAEVLRRQRELEDAKRELDLTVETRVAASVSEIREKAKIEAEAGLRLKVTEKEQQIVSMQKQIEELRRRAEQGSQQLQGEVMELELEAGLQARFPFDLIEPVAKGEFGGDVLQLVRGAGGQDCGSILWESKRTKNWSDGWLAKLRGDQRAAGADMALLVSDALPKGVESFDQHDGVWIAGPRHALPLATVLRQTLIEVAGTRQAREGQETKMELVYDYLTGSGFRHRVEAIVEKFTDMQADLERERKAMTRLWAKREAQINGVIGATVGMYGDLQGIAGQAIQEIDGLELPLLDDGSD